MASYRLVDATDQCKVARQGGLFSAPTDKCPCGNARCQAAFERVGLWEAWRVRHGRKPLWIAAGVVILLIGLAVAFALHQDPLARDVKNFQDKVAALEVQLQRLQSQSAPAPARGIAGATTVISQLTARAHELEDRVRRASAAGDRENAGTALAELDALPRQLESVVQAARQPPATGGPAVGDVRQLQGDLREAESAGNDLLEQVRGKPLQQPVEQSLADLQDQIRSVGRLLPKPAPPFDESAATSAQQEIEGALARAHAAIAAIPKPPVKPVLPWQPAEATLIISATSDLAETLILPLLEAGGGKTQAAEKQEWYYTGPAGAPPARVLVRRTDGKPFAALLEGKADLVITELPSTPEERQRFLEAFPGAALEARSQSEVIALDGLALLANPDAQDGVISAEMAERMTWWSGPAGSAGYAAAVRFGFHVTPKENLEHALLTDAQAHGVILQHQIGNTRARRLAYRPSPQAQALAASPFTIATEDYRFSMRIVAAVSPRSRPAATAFTKFATSEEGQTIVVQKNYVGIGLHITAPATSPEILSALASALGRKSITGATRLSAGIRFATGVSALDTRALAALASVPEELANHFPGTTPVVIGFTDNKGKDNQKLSEDRARNVAAQIPDGLKVKAIGMAAQIPVDTNETPEGRAQNRRAEIWAVTP